MKTATGILRREHDVILRIVDLLEMVADGLSRGEAVAADGVARIVDILRCYADRCHHAKEEQVLFPKLERKGIPCHGGPIAVLLHEHDLARSLIRDLTEFTVAYAHGIVGAGARWARAATEYGELLRHHIHKENNVLFAMAERVLSEQEQERLAEEMQRVEAEALGAHGPVRAAEIYETLGALRSKMFVATMASLGGPRDELSLEGRGAPR